MRWNCSGSSTGGETLARNRKANHGFSFHHKKVTFWEHSILCFGKFYFVGDFTDKQRVKNCGQMKGIFLTFRL